MLQAFRWLLCCSLILRPCYEKRVPPLKYRSKTFDISAHILAHIICIPVWVCLIKLPHRYAAMSFPVLSTTSETRKQSNVWVMSFKFAWVWAAVLCFWSLYLHNNCSLQHYGVYMRPRGCQWVKICSWTPVYIFWKECVTWHELSRAVTRTWRTKNTEFSQQISVFTYTFLLQWNKTNIK